ncbi:DNA ligase 1-like [Macrosteles quadrilineatus]|uniref:DNA ligase 1-like n=1 Tax=Macrosteles quadrilineatus TaxID=74068 RepID=UPI0023E2E3D4|nr:DNA ligase 1-like [Macrosteles quadrilineatus]
MKLWLNLEKEYDELFGEGEGEKKEDKEESKMENEFDDMFADIKKDLKKVPKEDLIPGLANIPKGSDSEEEEEEDEEEDTRKDFKKGQAMKKKGRKCKFGDKTYDVGERWKDPVTGKDMICILMNVPKDVQNRLAEADVTITKEEAELKEEKPSKPSSSGPQWDYTNRKSKRRGCPSDKESEMPDSIGSEEEKQNGNSTNQEDHNDELEGINKVDSDLPEKGIENLERDDSIDDKPGEEGGDSTEDSVPKENIEKESEENSEKTVVNEGRSERLEDSREATESESDTDSEEERRRVDKENHNLDDSEYEEEEDKTKHPDNKPEVIVTADDRETAVVHADDQKSSEPAKEIPEEKTLKEKEDLRKEENSEVNESHNPEKPPPSDEVPVIQEKGKTIYTKETTVTQRKLFKTSETIESVETERNVD